MERILYHGSEFIIENPEYKKGYVNKYLLRDDRLKILDLTKPPFNDVLNWVSLLMLNRELSNNMIELTISFDCQK